jgi:hypothetical protein
MRFTLATGSLSSGPSFAALRFFTSALLPQAGLNETLPGKPEEFEGTKVSPHELPLSAGMAGKPAAEMR